MNGRDFAERYEAADPRHLRSKDRSTNELLEGPRKWSSFFNDVAHGYLSGVDVDVPEVGDKVFTYLRWSEDYLPEIRKELMKREKVEKIETRDHYKRLQSELHFHTLTTSSIQLWEQLTNSHAELGDQRLAHIQTTLAVEAVRIALERRKIRKESFDTPLQAMDAVQVPNGQLTEIDTLITLTEIMREDRSDTLLTVAAPSLFEASTVRQNNVDFLMFNRESEEVVGIQSKTSVKNHLGDYGLRAVDLIPEGVVFIDGVSDLGNTEASEYRPGRGRASQPAPGLIAMDHLQRTNIRALPPILEYQHRGREFMAAKSIARELSGGRKSFIPKATAHVKKKIQHHLSMDGLDS